MYIRHQSQGLVVADGQDKLYFFDQMASCCDKRSMQWAIQYQLPTMLSSRKFVQWKLYVVDCYEE